MTNFAPIIIFLIVIFALLISAIILLGIWTYQDAKSRGLNAPLWVVVVLFVPNFIGLLLYFLVGRRESYTICADCGRRVPARSKFCPDCGSQMHPNGNPMSKRPSRGLMIAFVSCLAAMLLAGVIFAVSMISTGLDWHYQNSYSVFLKTNTYSATDFAEKYIGDNYNISFAKLNGTDYQNISIKNNNPHQLNVKTNLGSGKLTIQVSQGSLTESCQIPAGADSQIINLNDYTNGTLKLIIHAETALNGKVDISW